jgi:3-methyl-2-oxobutanoate hydroxymethyltransferase
VTYSRFTRKSCGKFVRLCHSLTTQRLQVRLLRKSVELRPPSFNTSFQQSMAYTGYLRDEQPSPRKPATTITRLFDMKANGEKIAALTCYDASFATLMSECGVDLLLVGDSLGNVVQGHSTVLPVALSDIAYHTTCVARGNRGAMLASDLPFGTYQTPEVAYRSAATLMAAGAQMVKLEGGTWLASTVEYLSVRGIPVFAHLGLTPQSVHKLGGFKVQGKSADAAAQIRADAQMLESAGASMLLLEAIPAHVGAELSNALSIPTIGIGAGPDCSGQILVMHDMLGVYPGRKAKFVRNFMESASSVSAAITGYIQAVKNVSFPASEHCF